MLAKWIDFLRQRLRALIGVCGVLLALLAIADAALRLTRAAAEHGAETALAEQDFWSRAYRLAENLPVFWTAFGVLGCLLLVLASKGVLAVLVARPEDYYGE